ncbi:MAG: methyltransferase domain-containing protein [Gammaproteobacteria bacterium]|nr:methyltransferase domain-containing protein [Gammaproteobacteria bacterium]TVQ46973.1 MAG: methyltransferase domain-containing protein [Gammaproteobacteria bacterium]
MRLRSLRNRLLASPRFQRWAAAFPLTRPVARRHTRELFDLVAGFVYSQVLAACVRLDLFERLAAAGPATSAALASACEVPEARLEVLLRAAAALRLLERDDGGAWDLGPLGAALRGNPGVVAMIRHHALLYEDLRDPVALLREGGPTTLGAFWGYAGAAAPAALAGQAVGDYSTLMAVSQQLVAEEILAAYPLRRHRRLLDVGGGHGAFTSAVAAHVPGLALAMFDLPAVAAQARERLEQSGLGSRIEVHGGDFFRDPLPRGADVITLVRIVHDHDDDAVRRLLRAVYEALPPGGRLLLAEPMAETRRAEPAGDAYFGLYLMAMGSGRPRSRAALEAMLAEAGFARVREHRTYTPLLTRLLVAQR